MKRWAVVFSLLALGASCPPKRCPDSCPETQACTDPALGCQPIPAPGPVCPPEGGTSCWHWPPGSTYWWYACPTGGVSKPTPEECPAGAVGPKIVNGKWEPFLRGSVNCCSSNTLPDGRDEGIEDGWSLGTATALDRISSFGTVNWTHMRPGPFADPSAPGGGGFGMIQPMREAVQRANARGIAVEVDVVDNWALCTCRGVSLQRAMMRPELLPRAPREGCLTWNLWGDNCTVTHQAPPERYIEWVNAVVDATWDLAVTYNLGNEGYRCHPDPAWERGLYDAIKARLRSHNVDRPVGSCIFLTDPRTQLDYYTFHGFEAVPDTFTRAVPIMLTESDNRPHTADEWVSYTRQMEEAGRYVAVWRGSDTWDTQTAALSRMPKIGQAWPGPTPPPVGCVPPGPNDSNWITGPKPSPEPRQDVLLAAMQALGDRCGKPADESLELLGAKLREMGYCAGKWADAVLLLAADDYWVQHHAVAYGTGCWITTGPNGYEGTWRYLGAQPTAGYCPDPKPATADGTYRYSCQDKGSHIDCTRTTVMQCGYCADIGMGEYGGQPRCGCPMRKEGHPERYPCEVNDGVPVMQSRNGASCLQVDGNVWMFYGRDGNCRLCNPRGTVCSEWY